jgi:hypothetical protein
LEPAVSGPLAWLRRFSKSAKAIAAKPWWAQENKRRREKSGVETRQGMGNLREEDEPKRRANVERSAKTAIRQHRRWLIIADEESFGKISSPRFGPLPPRTLPRLENRPSQTSANGREPYVAWT